MEIISINMWAVLAAAVANYIVGALWHGPVFGKLWMRLSGFTPESIKSMPLTSAKAMTLGFLFTVLMAYVLAHFSVVWGALDMASASELAFWIWLGFSMTTIAGGWLWEGKSFKLFAFNSAWALVSLMVSAWVLAVWI